MPQLLLFSYSFLLHLLPIISTPQFLFTSPSPIFLHALSSIGPNCFLPPLISSSSPTPTPSAPILFYHPLPISSSSPHFLVFSPFPHLLPLCSLRQLPIDLDLEDVEETAQQLLQALLLRHKYISSSLQTFFPTTNRFLRDIYQDSEIAAELNKESCCPNIMWLTSQQSKDKGEASLHLSLLVIVCK